MFTLQQPGTDFRAAVLVAAILLLLAPGIGGVARADADLCDTERGAPGGPVQASLIDGELGAPRRACARSEVAVGAGGLAVIELEDFYGRIEAAGSLRGSKAFPEGYELFARLEVVRYDTVISSVAADTLGLGHTTIGAAWALLSARDTQLSLSTRLVLPTAFALHDNSWPLAADVLLNVSQRVHPRLRVHESIGMLGSVGLGSGPADPRGGLELAVGAHWPALPWFALVLDLQSTWLYTAPLDVLAIGPGVRLGGERFGMELSCLLPMLGENRTLASALLQASWRL